MVLNARRRNNIFYNYLKIEFVLTALKHFLFCLQMRFKNENEFSRNIRQHFQPRIELFKVRFNNLI